MEVYLDNVTDSNFSNVKYTICDVDKGNCTYSLKDEKGDKANRKGNIQMG